VIDYLSARLYGEAIATNKVDVSDYSLIHSISASQAWSAAIQRLNSHVADVSAIVGSQLN
jgi:hypothetical protein